MKEETRTRAPLRRDLLVAAGVLMDRRGRVLLVANDWGRKGRVRYTLPGGMVEPGETAAEAVVREVREETGLSVTAIEHLAYVVQVEDKKRRERTIAMAFKVRWEGLLNPHDPDGHVVEARFFDVEAIAERLKTHLPLLEPLLLYLERGEPGRYHAYTGWGVPGRHY